MGWILIAIFIIGYCFIAIEQKIKLDKAATALITGVVCWVVYILSENDKSVVNTNLYNHIGEIAGILFFLIGAMTIVELIDLYNGFQLIIQQIQTKKKRTFLIIITLLAFILSAILDNLTTAIIMSSLVVKMIPDRHDRLVCIGMIVIAANAGGAWSPIGDVTTTMLWIGHQITTTGLIKSVFIPSLIATIIPLCILMKNMEGSFEKAIIIPLNYDTKNNQKIILFSGIGLLLFVPIFKTMTHLPPFMGMLLAVGIVWLISEIIHKKRQHVDEQKNSIFSALEKIDMPSLLFFLGILLAVAALDSFGILKQIAMQLNTAIPNNDIMLVGIGLLSAILDNVPLVAAMQGMYSLSRFPEGSFFWNLLAYCAGTGGSILIIGSAAGVAAMGIEQISFFWYLKKISLAALIGYLAGAGVCIIMNLF
jgi:Na+/H+ antiporter NhaD/arsenite permease-like protein